MKAKETITILPNIPNRTGSFTKTCIRVRCIKAVFKPANRFNYGK